MMNDPNLESTVEGSEKYAEDELPLEDDPGNVVDEHVDIGAPTWEVDPDVKEELRIAAAALDSEDFPEPRDYAVSNNERDSDLKAGES